MAKSRRICSLQSHHQHKFLFLCNFIKFLSLCLWENKRRFTKNMFSCFQSRLHIVIMRIVRWGDIYRITIVIQLFQIASNYRYPVLLAECRILSQIRIVSNGDICTIHAFWFRYKTWSYTTSTNNTNINRWTLLA